MDGSKFREQFCKGSLKEHSCETILKSDWSKFRKQFLKRATQGTFLWNYFKIRPAVSEKKIFQELLKKFNFVAMATRVFDGIKFCEQFLKKISQGTFLPSLVQIGPVVWEEKMFKEIVDDARRTPHHPKSSPWAQPLSTLCSGELKM